ncbi:MAG TPA: CPBP family glutamic-type intramembrane protease, partial [Ktedonobacterales bacterium]|nr:CPBP family glutamic-type intramembrane protease [Ktedonobacterales bacterium]
AAPYLHLSLTWTLAALVLLSALVLAAVGAGIGLWLGPSLGWDVLGTTGFLRNSAPIAALAGLLIGALQAIVAATLLGQIGLHQTPPPLWLGIIGALAGAVREEIIYRLGLMTLLVWLGARLFRQAKASVAIIWIANLLTAIVFGAQHLSSDGAVVSGQVSPVVFTVLVITYHAAAGLVFGWLYWRRGVLAAMLGHFGADLAITLLNLIPGFIA